MRRIAIWAVFGLMAIHEGCEGEPSFERELEQRVSDAVDAGFSGALLITVNGQQLVSNGYGLADRTEQRRNTVDTAYDVGSILKVFTAVALFKLEDDGKLSLTEPIGTILPDVPPDKAEITLREIMLHRAGFDEYHDTEGDFEAMTREQARRRILSQALLFEPGTDEAYSNAGYTLLADVIETRSGEPYTDYVRRVISRPAGMEQTGFYSEPLWESVATAIGNGGESFQDNDPASWPYTWALVGNGGLVTTVLDLNLFCDALWDERILGREALARFERESLSNHVVRVDGADVYASAGANDYGFGGVLIDVPSRRTRIIVGSNEYDALDLEAFAVDLLEWVLDQQ